MNSTATKEISELAKQYIKIAKSPEGKQEYLSMLAELLKAEIEKINGYTPEQLVMYAASTRIITDELQCQLLVLNEVIGHQQTIINEAVKTINELIQDKKPSIMKMPEPYKWN